MPSDPVRLGGSHVSFRVRFAAPAAPLIDVPAYAPSYDGSYTPPSFAGSPAAARLSTVGQAVPRRKGRVTAVTWSGQARPGDLGATQLLDAVRLVPQPSLAEAGEEATTRVLPRITAAPGRPHGPYSRSVPQQGGPRTQFVRPRPEPEESPWTPGGEEYQQLEDAAWMHSAAGLAHHHRYPGRKVDLGLVLLPLRVFLGCISVYAGFSKLCDPVYFDGGDRGSMMRWLSSLHPWSFAQPLLDFAMAHPVGAGLAVSFTQIVVGVLSVLGLWQRAAAAAATLLSVVLLFTVSWQSVPAYDTPDIIYLAAWSPLLIAGAPFGSLDGRLALEAWRRLGPTAAAHRMRRRVLQRGAVLCAVVVGATLLLGSVLGAAVRTGGVSTTVVPHPSAPPTDYGTPTWPARSPEGGTGGSVRPSAPSPSRPATRRPKPRTSLPGRPAGTGRTPAPGRQPSGTAPGATGSAHHGGTGSGSTHPASPVGGTTSTPGGQQSTQPRPSHTGGAVIGGLLGSGTVGGLPVLGMDGTVHAAPSGTA
ncbi:DoxX family protein [Streptacidiphilus griseoplanus]|uniref:DoxX family protein n=1 Tax=Peterkaempfera griseoplana TaxID=66896 RepID=UPI001FDEE713|nr:DoxX family protein [Peterkaempfera griseoplana]